MTTNDYISRSLFYLDTLMAEKGIDMLEAKKQYANEFPMDFRAATDQLRKKNHLSLYELADSFHMERKMMGRWLDNPSKYRNEDFLTLLALILELPDWISRLLFRRANFQFDDDDRRHQALKQILTIQSTDGVEKANEFLMQNHLRPLSV